MIVKNSIIPVITIQNAMKNFMWQKNVKEKYIQKNFT